MMEQLKPRRPGSELGAGSAELIHSSALPAPSSTLGEYHILREIGRGGMGVVYEARQETLGRHVALKVMPAQLLANERLRSRFRREAQAAARLHHTNIVPVFGVGEQDGLYYYIMQLIPGRSLDNAIAQPIQPLRMADGGWRIEETTDVEGAGEARSAPSLNPPSAIRNPQSGLSHRGVARIGVQVADALAYAHAHGVVHRDIKPSNLLLDDQGTVWVTDFGVAQLGEGANLTGSGDVVGTIKYMPPERFHGRSDARGDVYSLGITLYELLARRPAFPDTTPHHLIQLIGHSDPPR